MKKLDINKAKELLFEREYASVIKLCNEVLESGPIAAEDEVAALHLKGSAHYFSNQLGQSIQCFKAALSKNPKHTDSAVSLSIVLNDIGKYEEAKQVYTIANQGLKLKKSGNDYDLDRKFSIKHLELADLYFKFHRYDEALDDYLKASKLDPQNLSLRIKMAKVYAKKGFISRAIQELQQLCSENPDDIDSRIQLGLMYFSQGNVIDAQTEWERAEDISPQNTEVMQYLNMAKHASETRL